MKETNRNRANVAKRKARQRKLRNRRIALTVCLMLVVMVASIGGTVAWLTAQTTPVVNTFTYGDINIDLYEHAYDAASNTLGTDKVTQVTNYKIIPGVNLPKDPTVEVKANSEACWLFVKVEQTGDFVEGKVSYSIANDWQPLEGVNGVYYREVGATTENKTFNILTDNRITVSEELTKTEIANKGTVELKFTAYAVQKDGVADAATAWAKVTP